MKNYELLYIIPSSYTDEEMGKIETKVSGILTKFEASIEATRRLGKFRLTYPIKHQRHGLYVMVTFNAETPKISKIEDMLRITPEVLRSLITLNEDGASEQKFDLVQFAEVVIESREERGRRQERSERPADKKEDKPAVAPAETALSAADLDKKIDTALQADTRSV